jgi:hypothetical protein
MIDDEEQAEIWAAHRVGGRPEVALSAWDGEGYALAMCRGWSPGAPVHRRAYRVDENGVEIEDRVEGASAELTSRWLLAPGWEVELGAGSARVRLVDADTSGPALRFQLSGALDWSVERGAYYPSFGQQRERAVLVGRGRAPLETRIRIDVEPDSMDAAPAPSSSSVDS